MEVILILILFGIGGWYLFTGVFDLFFGKSEKNDYYNSKPDKITHIHHHTHNNLNVHSEDFKEYLDKKLKP